MLGTSRRIEKSRHTRARSHQHQHLRTVLVNRRIQRTLEQLQPLVYLQGALPAALQIQLRTRCPRLAHPFAGPHWPRDGYRRRADFPTGASLHAIAGVLPLEAIADRVLARSEVAQYRGKRGE